MNIKLITGCWLTITGMTLLGCSFEKIGQNTGRGLGKSMIPAIDTIERNLINGLRTELTKEAFQKDLEHFIDSVLTPVTRAVRNTTGSVRDSLINHQTLIWADSLIETVTGQHLNQNMRILQTTLMDKSKTDIYELERSLQHLLGEMLGDSTKIKLGILRDELLGPKTGVALNRIIDTVVSHIVDSSVARLSKRIRSDIDPLLKDNVSFLKRNALSLLIALAALAAIIITLIWLNRRKYLRMVAMLTKQIHDIPNQELYDTITARVKNEAVTAGLEPTLRKVLQENGLLGSEAWKKNISP